MHTMTNTTALKIVENHEGRAPASSSWPAPRRAAFLAKRLRGRVFAIISDSFFNLARQYAHDMNGIGITSAGRFSPLGPLGIIFSLLPEKQFTSTLI
jgi:hypothetical protein